MEAYDKLSDFYTKNNIVNCCIFTYLRVLGGFSIFNNTLLLSLNHTVTCDVIRCQPVVAYESNGSLF